MELYLEIQSTCVLCDACRVICPENAIIYIDQTFAIETWSCTLCNLCTQICPVEAIKGKSRSFFTNQD